MRYSFLLTQPSDPEALGSAAGSVVPPRLGLLWPHPSPSLPSAGLFSSSWRLFVRSHVPDGNRGVPHFTPHADSFRAVFRTPADGQAASVCFYARPTGLRPLCRDSASASPRYPVTRGQRNEAAKFALCYGPERSLALHRKGLLHLSFHLMSHLDKMSNITSRQQTIPVAGLSPARHAALWAASKERKDRKESDWKAHKRRMGPKGR